MNVLITGADGVLGNNLVRELLSRNHQVSILCLKLTHTCSGLDELPVRRLYGNILDVQAVDNAVHGHDVVIHAAASTQVYPARDPDIRKVNVDGTINIINACLKFNIDRLIFVGTANSFTPGPPSKPGDENSQFVGWRYGLDYIDSKHEAQKLVLKSVEERKLRAIIVNPTFIIGPYDTKPSSGSLVVALYRKRIPGYTKGSKSYISAKDAAVAIVNAITMGEVGQCYILGNYNLTYKEAFTMIANVIGVKPPFISMNSKLVLFYGQLNTWYCKLFSKVPQVTKELAMFSCDHCCYSGEKARNQLSMPCTDLRIAIEECFIWFKQNGYLKEI